MSSDFNLDSDGSCGFGGPNDISNGDANLGPLADNGGPTLTHYPLAASDAIDNGPATCLPADQRGQPRPVGPACDIGSVEVKQSSTLVLCASRYTGAVTSPTSGQCGTGQVELVTPDMYPLAFCIDRYTGAVLYTFNRPCNPPRMSHIVPDDGDLLTCVSRYTGKHRWVMNHAQCGPYEIPNTVPATL